MLYNMVGCWQVFFSAVAAGGVFLGVLGLCEETPAGEPMFWPPVDAETFLKRTGYGGEHLWVRPKEKPKVNPSYFKSLTPNSKVKTPQHAVAIADLALDRARGMWAEEWTRVVGLVGSGVDIPGYVVRGERIWIIWYLDLTFCVTQEAWVSSTTGEVRWIFPIDTPPAPIKPAKHTRVREN